MPKRGAFIKENPYNFLSIVHLGVGESVYVIILGDDRGHIKSFSSRYNSDVSSFYYIRYNVILSYKIRCT